MTSRQPPDGPAALVDGYFPADSMIRRIHRERLIAFSGIRALLMQACDPLAVVGFKRHSVIFDNPGKRLQSTDQRMSRMYFGSEEVARRTGAEIAAMHDRVNGKTKAAYGPIPAGSHYSAADPKLMLWTLATLADSALVYYEGNFGSLSDRDREAYWQDYREIGSLLGMPDNSMPETEPELRAYVRGRLDDGSLYISDETRANSKSIIFNPPFGGLTRLALTPVTEAIKLSSVGFLPRQIRRLYGFRWDPAREALLRSSLLQVRIGARAWPDLIRLHTAARTPADRVYGEKPSVAPA